MPQPLEVLGAMLLSFALNLFIAQLYRSTYKGTRYSQDFVQTLIMIGTITTILIMVVSGNSGIAFGMFAAFSMIRFRRNLGQARDLGFVFYAMATGMVVGARLYEMALIVTLLVGALLYFISRSDAFSPRKASHLLTLRMTSDMSFEERLNPLWGEFTDQAELLSVRSAQAGMMTELRYGLQLKTGVKVSDLMERLQIACGNNRVVLTPTGNELDV
ncbi:DUF4956 domain-containing protein [Luteolibacter yonseiensis]|uniref:DUF4956 domain-containing protein n=2 Tax=Luteolibacter yonseiensis TaxID=1144680 RepID=A0A934QXB3_9BACT|nr:DUF4956 domain-containing protein [Luteolibacter yonseiensis]MBK1814443.1 DUF4956 domain-containing protein [Luteolibacter yonseiensis]